MSTAIALQVGAVCLFIIGLLLWLDDWPHMRKRYRNHTGCEVCRDDRYSDGDVR